MILPAQPVFEIVGKELTVAADGAQPDLLRQPLLSVPLGGETIC